MSGPTLLVIADLYCLKVLFESRLNNLVTVVEECEQSTAVGFTGKSCIVRGHHTTIFKKPKTGGMA